MRFSRSLRSAVATSLLAILAVLGTGLPSHHHVDALDGDGGARLISADHHAHATRLVEQDDRMPAGEAQLAVPTSVAVEAAAPAGVLPASAPNRLLRAKGRAPPPGAPRAPPHRI